MNAGRRAAVSTAARRQQKSVKRACNPLKTVLLYASIQDFRVWRSLVSRLNGVQEAAGSNPVTRTKNRWGYFPDGFLLLQWGFEPAAVRREAPFNLAAMSRPPAAGCSVRIQSLGPRTEDSLLGRLCSSSCRKGKNERVLPPHRRNFTGVQRQNCTSIKRNTSSFCATVLHTTQKKNEK